MTNSTSITKKHTTLIYRYERDGQAQISKAKSIWYRDNYDGGEASFVQWEKKTDNDVLFASAKAHLEIALSKSDKHLYSSPGK